MNKSIWLEINPKPVYISLDEEFDENSVSTSRKKLLPLEGISTKIQENSFNEQEQCSSLTCSGWAFLGLFTFGEGG